MYSFSYLEPVCCSMPSSICCFLTCIQVPQKAGQVVCYSHLLQNFPQFFVIHTVKGFGIVNNAETDVFLELSCFFDDPVDVGDLISGTSAFSKTRLNIWKFTGHILLKPDLGSFEHYFTSLWDECNCVVVWTFFGIAFLWDWNENWPFPVLWPLLSFPNLISCVQIWKNSILRSMEWLAQNSIKRVCLVLSRNSNEASVAERDCEWGREGIKRNRYKVTWNLLGYGYYNDYYSVRLR